MGSPAAMAAKPLDVVVAGGSLAGLSAGLAMLRLGHNVQIYERSPSEDRTHRGAGIVVQKHVLEYFRRYGLPPPDKMSIECPRRQYLDRSGAIIRREDYTQRMTSWSVLFKALRDAFPSERYHIGRTVARIEASEGKVKVHTAKDEELDCDVLLAGDGSRSAVRSQLLPQVKRRYAGYAAWRGVVSEKELSDVTAETFVERFCFYHGPGSQILSYLIPGPGGTLTPGERDLNWVWYWNYPEGPEFDNVLTDTSGKRHEDALSAGQVRDEVWGQQRQIASETLPPQFAEIVQQTRQPFLQLITDMEVPKMAHGRIVLLGEAAFVPRPHTAAAADQAFSNALGLGDAFSSAGDATGVEPLLREWEPEQLAYGQHLQELGQSLGNRSQFGSHAQVLDVKAFQKGQVASTKLDAK